MSEEQLIPTPSLFGETGNFLLEREMGRGGMGGVYLGRDKMLDRPVAVKVMLKEYGDDAEFVEKFKREAQAAARLIHPNIAQIYTYGIANGMPYIAMELVAGGSLDQLMQHSGASIDITRVMKIGEQVAQALRCAADQGLVHGDVKPENILLDANGNAKLVDFGLAAMQKNTNEIWGTPYYIAPEKVKKEAVDFRADMYSLGGTLYHALTGVAPFEGDDAAAVVRKRFEGAPVPPSQIRPGISPQIDALILKMLALDPAERYPSFEALLEDFKRIMTYGLTAGGTGRMPTGALPSGHKIGLKGRKRFKMKTSTTKLGSTGELSEFSEDGEGGEGESGGTGGPRVKRRPTMTAAAKGTPDEEGGSVAGKVLGVIGITVGAIALVAGALVWYVIADRNARAAEKQAQIVRQLDLARTSISETRKNAAKFREEISEMARKAVADCDKTTANLKKELSGKVDASQLESIKPPPSAELLAAIAMTNAAAQAASGDTNALAAAMAPLAAAMADAMQGMASNLATAVSAAVVNIPKFRPPNDDEADPASPEHETYLKEKAAWEKEQREKLEREAAEKKAAAAAPAAAPAAPAADEPVPTGDSDEAKMAAIKAAFRAKLNDMVTSARHSMGELWDRAYGCEAASIRICKAIDDLLAKIDEFKVEGSDEDAMRKAADFSNIVKGEYDTIKAGEDVSKVQKAGNYIRQRGGNTIQQAINGMLKAVKEMEREIEKLEAEIAERKHQEELARLKAKTIEEDNKRIREKFDSLVRRDPPAPGDARRVQVLREPAPREDLHQEGRDDGDGPGGVHRELQGLQVPALQARGPHDHRHQREGRTQAPQAGRQDADEDDVGQVLPAVPRQPQRAHHQVHREGQGHQQAQGRQAPEPPALGGRDDGRRAHDADHLRRRPDGRWTRRADREVRGEGAAGIPQPRAGDIPGLHVRRRSGGVTPCSVTAPRR